MSHIRRTLRLAVVAGVAFAGWLGWYGLTPIHVAGPVEFEITPGLGLRGAARAMQSAGLPVEPWRFSLLGRVTGKAGKIKAGSYLVTENVTPWRLLEKLSRGDVTQADIVFVEGRTFRELRAALNANPNLRHDSLSLSDAQIMMRIGAVEADPEGLFFPDTYLFAKQSSDLEVLRRAYHAMQKHLAAAWEQRDTTLPYASPYEALIMASIVEKETGIDADRPLVAAVFVNRLRRGMLLQTDPTVIYGLGERFDGNLRKKDLLADTPYNTYVRRGLPPTPIAMPGLASLKAATRPPQSDVLYFVARGDGSSEFSRTLDAHNRAVARYQKRSR